MSEMANEGRTLTLTVPEAGRRYFGLKRDAAYRAAQRGDLPTIRIGRTLRCPIAALDRLLEQAGQERKQPGKPTK